MGDLVKKTKVVPFLGNSYDMEKQDWTQIKKSTAFSLSLNPQTKTFDFISSEQPEEEIDSYQPSLSQSLTMFKGEPDYQTIFDMVYELPTGEKAHRPALIVFYQEKAAFSAGDGKTETVYKAWWVDSLVKLNQMDTPNEQIDFDLAFNEIKRGAVRIMKNGMPWFAEGTFADGKFTLADGASFPSEIVPQPESNESESESESGADGDTTENGNGEENSGEPAQAEPNGNGESSAGGE